MRLGIHTSTAGSLAGAAEKAAELGANTFQIFSASPRMWRATHPSEEAVRAMRASRERYDLYPLLVHANYLINLAAPEGEIRRKSIEAFRAELRRSQAIGAEFVVVHPGSCGERCADEGIDAVARGLAEASASGAGAGVTVLLENTVGSGRLLGGRLEELRAIRARAAELTDLEIGYCLDTCHLLCAGFDIASAAGLRAAVKEIEATLGLAQVRAFHANDSKTPCGSRRDRHENIGAGHIGCDGFRRILTHPKLRGKPFVLETPVEKEGDDRRNLDALKSLARRAPARRGVSSDL